MLLVHVCPLTENEKLAWRERYIDDEPFLLCVKTEYDEDEVGEVSVEKLVENNTWHLPPQYKKEGPVLEAFRRFQKELSALLFEHVSNFAERMASAEKVGTFSLL
jgi:hypothetical protein